MTVAKVSANKISTVPKQCHPAVITQMVMDGLRCPLGDATQSERGQRQRLLVLYYSCLHLLACVHNVFMMHVLDSNFTENYTPDCGID